MHEDINGDKLVSKLNAEDLDDAFFDYVFCRTDKKDKLNKMCKANINILEEIKKDFG